MLTLTACTPTSSYDEWNRGTTGAAVGGTFGSLIGDIIGGYRGHVIGSLVGGAAGAAIGVASAQNDEKRQEVRTPDNYHNRHNNQSTPYYDPDIYYDNGHDYRYEAPAAPFQLDVTNVIFADENNNRCLEAGETAYVTFEIHNRSDKPVFNVAPVITCNNKRIHISPTATIAKIDAHRGMRYKAMVSAQTNVKSGQTTFNISFVNKVNRLDPVKTFVINVRKPYRR